MVDLLKGELIKQIKADHYNQDDKKKVYQENLTMINQNHHDQNEISVALDALSLLVPSHCLSPFSSFNNQKTTATEALTLPNKIMNITPSSEGFSQTIFNKIIFNKEEKEDQPQKKNNVVCEDDNKNDEDINIKIFDNDNDSNHHNLMNINKSLNVLSESKSNGIKTSLLSPPQLPQPSSSLVINDKNNYEQKKQIRLYDVDDNIDVTNELDNKKSKICSFSSESKFQMIDNIQMFLPSSTISTTLGANIPIPAPRRRGPKANKDNEFNTNISKEHKVEDQNSNLNFHHHSEVNHNHYLEDYDSDYNVT